LAERYCSFSKEYQLNLQMKSGEDFDLMDWFSML
jgi:hypothetical protein